MERGPCATPWGRRVGIRGLGGVGIVLGIVGAVVAMGGCWRRGTTGGSRVSVRGVSEVGWARCRARGR